MKKIVFVSLLLLCCCTMSAVRHVTVPMNQEQAVKLLSELMERPSVQRVVAEDEVADPTLIYNDSLSIEYHFVQDGIYYKITDFEKREVEVAPISGTIDLVELNGRPTYRDFGDMVIPAQVVVPDEYEAYAGNVYTVTRMGRGSLSFTRGITSVTMPNTVTSIGETAFALCQSVKSVKFSENIKVIEGLGTFILCVSLESVSLPDSLTTLPSMAFAMCLKLKKVELSENITVIPDATFVGCIELADVYIPEGVTHIGSSAFMATSITHITLPSTLQWIGDYAFYTAEKMDMGAIGYEDYVFPDYVEVYSLAAVPPTVGGVYDEELEFAPDTTGFPDISYFGTDSYENAILYVPEGSADAYRSAEMWSNFNNIDEAESSEDEKIMVGIITYTDNVMTGMIGIFFPKGEAQSGIVTENTMEGYHVEKMMYEGHDVTQGMFYMQNMYVGTDVPLLHNTLFEVFVEKPTDVK